MQQVALDIVCAAKRLLIVQHDLGNAQPGAIADVQQVLGIVKRVGQLYGLIVAGLLGLLLAQHKTAAHRVIVVVPQLQPRLVEGSQRHAIGMLGQ